MKKQSKRRRKTSRKRRNRTRRGGGLWDLFKTQDVKTQDVIKTTQDVPMPNQTQSITGAKYRFSSNPPDPTIFQFTRHLPSCNNIGEGKLLGKDFEPSGSKYGILKTLEYAEQNPTFFDSDTVCVSNLLRTWITAALLYSKKHNVHQGILHLYVYPFLKEKTKKVLFVEIKRGNYPKPIDHTLSKFKMFLDAYASNLTATIKLYIQKQKEGFTEFSFDKQIDQTYKLDFAKKGGGLDDSEDIDLERPSYSEDDLKDFDLEDDSKEFAVKGDSVEESLSFQDGFKINCKGEEIEDTIGPYTPLKGFKTDGDLEKFMESYLKNPIIEGSTSPQEQKFVHVVTHSATMKAYLKDHNLSEYGDNYDDVIKTNLWSFRTFKNATHPIELKLGVALDKEQATIDEKKPGVRSLCGKTGSVEVINICGNEKQRRFVL